jgi:hypothetical protein
VKLYHATKSALTPGDHLRTKTGREDGDILSGGAVYLTDTPDRCRRYGDVYAIECTAPTQYKIALAEIGRSKKPRYTTGVYVARPQDTVIIGRQEK